MATACSYRRLRAEELYLLCLTDIWGKQLLDLSGSCPLGRRSLQRL